MFDVAACGKKHDDPVIEYTKYSVVVYGEGDKDVVENWQKLIPKTADDAELTAATVELWESFQSNGGVRILSDLCAGHGQDLAIFNLIYSDAGMFSHASVVFPQKDEDYDKNVPVQFFNEMFSSLKEVKVDSWDTAPYLRVIVVVKDYKTGGPVANGVHEFYFVYMRNFLKGKDNSDLCRTHMSDELISQLRERTVATGADAVIHAQDMNDDAIETLKVEPVGDDWYLVKYFWNRNKPESVTTIRVKAVRDEIGVCKILEIE